MNLKPFKDLPYGTKFRYQGSQEVWVRTQHNVIAGWSENLRQCGRQSLCSFCHLDDDEDGNTLETLVEVVEDRQVEQHQGEPVAWLLCNGDEQPIDSTIRWDVAKHWPEYAAPLFTHADPGEVERLRLALETMTKDRDAEKGMKSCARLQRDVQAALAERRGAQLAERDALLRECLVLANRSVKSVWSQGIVDRAEAALERKP